MKSQRSEPVADAAQVEILKEKGVEAWNEWRRTNPKVRIDLTGVDFIGAKLRGANLNSANLTGASFGVTNMIVADTNLSGRPPSASLREADLRNANLTGANLCAVDLGLANLQGALLLRTDCGPSTIQSRKSRGEHMQVAVSANLSGTNLGGAELLWVNFNETILTSADFSNCIMARIAFTNVDLSCCKGLDTVSHFSPSIIGIETIYRSYGKIPDVFLRGAGVPEPFIAQMKSLVAAMSPIEFYSCFISYSSKDQEFAERLHADLRSKNVRCWFAPEDLKIGDRLRPAFDEAIRVHDKLMVLLSKNSVNSLWVEKEVETAFEKEREEKRTVLFPIRLDDAVMETNEAWATDIRRTRHIGDFRDWKNHDSYKKAFERLLRDLKAEDKGKPA
jgi:hypothetical protein